MTLAGQPAGTAQVCGTHMAVLPTFVCLRQYHRYLDLLRQPGGVSRAVWDEMRQLSGEGRVPLLLCLQAAHWATDALDALIT